MLESIIRAALKQRIVIALAFLAAGAFAVKKLSVDAFPDVTNVQVQVATESIGRSPEEMERFITIPLEIAMTGLPGLTEMRSLNKNGLSLITLVFTDSTDVFFARQLVMERLMEVMERMPEGVTPVLGPVSTGLGEVYQYTLEKDTDGDSELTREDLMERRAIQDWVVRPMLRGIPGVAEINSQGGYVKQYQALVNPDRLSHYGLKLKDISDALARNNANSGGGILQHYVDAGKVSTFEGTAEVVPDIRAIPAPGHTPGHTFYVLESKGEKLVFWGDLLHVPDVQMPNPEATIVFDVDQKTAAITRKAAFADAAQGRYWIAGAHIPYPGVGHLKVDGGGYRWVPITYINDYYERK